MADYVATRARRQAGGDTLAKICHESGKLSDDGDSIVDKYSGRVIRKIDFVDEEGYTPEGFKIVTHKVMEKDIEKTVMEVLTSKNKERVFENELATSIYNLLHTICENR